MDDLLPRVIRMSWRWPAAVVIVLLGLAGLWSGVGLSERPEVINAGWLTRFYYVLGLFVVGGLDLGTPEGGPLFGRAAMWLAYFGAPLLTASAVVDALLHIVNPGRWHLRRLRDHIILAGTDDLTDVFLRVLRAQDTKVQVVVVAETPNPTRAEELEQTHGCRVVCGDIGHEFFLAQLRPKKARRVLLLGDHSFSAFETADTLLRLYPKLAGRIVLHCQRLRFLRAMQDTDVAQRCITFNAYGLAAEGLVQDRLVGHFQRTEGRDVVVIAGFGRFGQSLLEELWRVAGSEIDQLVLVDIDAELRVQVVDEQERIGTFARRLVLEGDISHPRVWRDLEAAVDLDQNAPTIILGTGRSEENLRTALWIKRRHANARVFARTNSVSAFARRVAQDHGVESISITELVEAHIKAEWLS